MYDELREQLIERAKQQRTMYYEEIAPMFDLDFDRDHDRAEVGRILGEISKAEAAESRPMLSALVVHKGGDEMPGGGFFSLAGELGRYRGGGVDRKLWWAMEVKKLYEYWRGG
jgi:hypothetical protein